MFGLVPCVGRTAARHTRRALLVVALAACSGDDTSSPAGTANPHLTVEPILIDAGIERPEPGRKRRIGMGDHRRREEEDLREYRRQKRARAAAAREATADGGVGNEAAQEQQRREAELRRLSDMPLESLTNPNGWSAP